MLKIVVPAQEYWNEEKEKFEYKKEVVLQLEHSLVSISKWEAKWHKPYLTDLKKYEKTLEETIDYVRCMTLTQNVDPEVYTRLSSKNIEDISKYINDPQTATWFSNEAPKSGKSIVTNEVIYTSMILLNVPVEFQKWHINHLMTLLRVLGEKQQQPKQMSKAQLAQRNASLNAARRAAHRSKG